MMAIPVAILVMVTMLLVRAPLVQPAPQAIFIFGDGFLDVGNNIYIPGGAEVGEPTRADHPYYGIDFPGSKITGRFSNGYNLADFIAKSLAFEMSPPAYESLPKPSPVKMEGFTGVNYACVDAGIRNSTNGDITYPLMEQVGQFAATRTQLKDQLGGRKPLNNFLSKSLFLIAVGAMDLNPGYNMFLYVPQNDNRTEVQRLIELYGATLTELHAMGARRFGIINVGPCAEYMCDGDMNKVAVEFNSALGPLLSGLQANLRGFHYSLFDFYGFSNATFENPSASGFVSTGSACWPGYGSPCSNRTEFWFWDDYGYITEQAAKVTASAFYNDTANFTTPVNIKRLFPKRI